MRANALRSFSSTLHTEFEDEDEKSIDFSSVGLYLAGLQVIFTIVLCATVTVISCWVLGSESISAIRTLAVVTCTGAALLRLPLRIGRARGVSTLFNALRPCLATYILGLVLEQLVHTCTADQNGVPPHALQQAVHFSVSAGLLISGFARAKNPRSESDLPFLLTAVCLLVTAILPPPAVSKSGPLCEPTTVFGAGERVLRALLFSSVYVVLVYAAAPSHNNSNEIFICVARANAAAVWVLGATMWALPLAPVQIAVILFSRLGENNDEKLLTKIDYENLPLNSRPSTPDAENGELSSNNRSILSNSKIIGTQISTNGSAKSIPIFDFNNSTRREKHGGLSATAVAAAIARDDDELG
jgi:hypothetical protein